MHNQTNDPGSRFSRLLAEVSGVSARTTRAATEPAGLADEVILLANNKCRLLPHIRGATSQPVEEWSATSDLQQLSKWAAEHFGCGWELVTGWGLGAGIVVLKAESEAQLAAIRHLYRDEVAETLHARDGSRTLAFYHYPKDAYALSVGEILLKPGLVVLADGCRVLLPCGADSWPDLDAPILPTPAWLRHCAFESFDEGDSRPLRIPPQLQIVGGTDWRKGNARRS